MARPIARRCRLWVILLSLLAAPTTSLAQEVPAAARTCKVGAYIMALHSIEFESNTFGADIWIWSLCRVEHSDYSQLRLSVTLERTEYTGFIKLTVGLFAATAIALLAFFFDPNNPNFFTGKMGLLVGALFAVVLNLRAADTVLGNTVEVTLVAALHILGAMLILLMALLTAWHQQQAERGRVLAYPNWPLIATVSAGYALANLLLIALAAS